MGEWARGTLASGFLRVVAWSCLQSLLILFKGPHGGVVAFNPYLFPKPSDLGLCCGHLF